MSAAHPVFASAEAEYGYRSALIGAGDQIRTDDIYLGKVTLYQLSYARIIGAQGETRTRKIWLLRPTRIPIPSPGLNYYNNTQQMLCQLIWYQETGSNRPRTDFQSVALPTELSWCLAEDGGVEPHPC